MTDLEIATIAARAIQTLETLRDYGCIENDDSTPALFTLETVAELKSLIDAMKARGVKAADIDYGGYGGGAARERAALADWNAGQPLKLPESPRIGFVVKP